MYFNLRRHEPRRNAFESWINEYEQGDNKRRSAGKLGTTIQCWIISVNFTTSSRRSLARGLSISKYIQATSPTRFHRPFRPSDCHQSLMAVYQQCPTPPTHVPTCFRAYPTHQIPPTLSPLHYIPWASYSSDLGPLTKGMSI